MSPKTFWFSAAVMLLLVRKVMMKAEEYDTDNN